MRKPRPARPVRDKGSALMLCIVFVLLGSLLLVPLLRYTATVIRANGQQRTKINAAEVARGALRTSMASPEALYDVCSNSGLHTAVELAILSSEYRRFGTRESWSYRCNSRMVGR